MVLGSSKPIFRSFTAVLGKKLSRTANLAEEQNVISYKHQLMNALF